MRSYWRGWIAGGMATALVATLAAGQQSLGNSDVVEMVKGGVPESTIVRAVQSSQTAFDVSPAGLIALSSAGVSEKIMEAMIAAANQRGSQSRTPRRTPSARGGAAGRDNAAAATSRRQPSVFVLAGAVPEGARTPIPLQRTTLAQTREKPASLAGLATDQVIDDAIGTGVSTVRRSGGAIGRTASGAVRGIAGALTRGGSGELTYIWVLQRGAVPQVLDSEQPSFEVGLNATVGLSAADYAPAIVKLTPTPRGALLVGATRGKSDATESGAAEWPLYSAFVEDRVEASVRPLDRGTWQIATTAPLAPGDYAVVLRPLSKDKKYSGVDVARSQGDGLAFNSVWPFSVK